MDFCEVETRDVSPEQIRAAARMQPRDSDDWYMTLTRGEDDFMDATIDLDGKIGLRCSEGGRKFATSSGVGEETLESLMLSFYERDGRWRQLCKWDEAPEKRSFSLKGLFK